MVYLHMQNMSTGCLIFFFTVAINLNDKQSKFGNFFLHWKCNFTYFFYFYFVQPSEQHCVTVFYICASLNDVRLNISNTWGAGRAGFEGGLKVRRLIGDCLNKESKCMSSHSANML